ncbi:4-hydroxybenzoate polyprenyltransferase [Bacillus thermophilus]|uniref:4-hydroxybenzoate polyprenyltransferase n=1 Tax=Siminovitchia thermophila TaxID=1245522 RepID=A0ABS2R2Q3_9BACI|nr:4-hydroxybenzoate polyprenyltransferase [Siminovitchia thermophila]ONK22461.1 hypothetical protein BLX87_15630 [Bacillus sp. VT-16-64]
MKEKSIIGLLLILTGILITFFLNTATMIISLIILISIAIFDIFTKPSLKKILFYVILFFIFFLYLYFR